jgi:putative membrane-bound dehydrogenase-like protein
MIQNPTNIDIDHLGRVWAVECINYRKYGKIRPEGDRVVIVEDTNGDGEADKDKTFFQSPELTNPLGICVLPQAKGTKVIVSAAPNVWLLTDKDGDDVADDAVKIFKTTGTWDYDHQIHAFVFGPDGKFYFNFGDAATSLTWPDGTVVKDLAGNEITNKGTPYRKGMVFRCDIDLATGKATNVETLGWNFRNNYEVTIDSFGTLWQSDNDDDGNKGVRINYVMEFGNYGYTDEKTGAGWQSKRINLEQEIPRRHWYQNDPGVVPNLLLTGAGSPTGITVNEGTALGAKFANQMIHCDAGPRTTRAYPVTSDGAGYKAEMIDILTSSDSWYRASDCAIAPDGSLVVSDWYDSGVGGHAMGDHEPGKIMGRLYRVSATGGGKLNVPPVELSSATGAVNALQSPNRATRYMAWTALSSMGTRAIPELEKLGQDANPRLRARALGILSQIKGNEVRALTTGLSDRDENVRIFAIRLCSVLEKTRGLDTTPLENNEALVGKLLKDTPAVRRQIAIALSGAKDIAKLWTALALQHDGKDRWYLEALGIGALGNEDACFDAWLTAVGDKWNSPAGRDIVWRMRATKASGYLAKLLQDTSVKPEEQQRYLRSFDFIPASDARTAALVEVATAGKAADSIAREALSRLKGSKEPTVVKALASALESAKGTPQFIELVRDFAAEGQGRALLETGLKFSRDPLAADAVKLIFADRDGEKLISEALAGPQGGAVVDLLAASGSSRAITRRMGLLVNPDEKLETRKTAVQGLARAQAGAEALVKLAKEQKFPEALKLTAASALRSVQYAKLTDDINALFPLPSAQGGKALPPVASLAKLSGDPAKGKAVFARVESTCVTCHKIGDVGFDVGPGLSEIGGKLPKEAIFEAILNPNAGLSMGFETQQFMLKDGNAAAGIVRSETKDEILLALPGGATQKLNPKEVTKREKLPTSLMPAGLSAVLSQDDLVNLVEYLASLKKK